MLDGQANEWRAATPGGAMRSDEGKGRDQIRMEGAKSAERKRKLKHTTRRWKRMTNYHQTWKNQVKCNNNKINTFAPRFHR